MTGASRHGQGQETSFAQIVADQLGVDISDITVIHGDTAIVQYGIGTFGSRATAVGGTAVYMAVEKLIEKARQIAAHMMGVDVSGVAFNEGKFSKVAARAASAAATEAPEPMVPVGQAPAGALPEPEDDGKQVTIQEVALEA